MNEYDQNYKTPYTDQRQFPSVFSRLNPFSKHFFLVSDKSKQEDIDRQTTLNSVGVSREDMQGMKEYMRQHYQNLKDNNGDIAASAGADYRLNLIEDSINGTSKIQRQMKYREMERFPEISDALDYICDEAIFTNKENRVVTLNFNRDIPPEIKRIISAEFDYITFDVLKLQENGWEWFRDWIVDGELFLELVMNDNRNRIINVKKLPTNITFPIYNGNEIMYFVQKLDYLNPATQQETSPYNTNGDKNKPFYDSYNTTSSRSEMVGFDGQRFVRLNNNQVLYQNYGRFGESFIDVTGYLESSLVPYDYLKNLEQALLIYRIVRAPERFVFNVEVGDKMAPEKAREQVERLRNEWRKRDFVKPDANGGTIDSRKSFMAVLEDFWFAKRGGVGSSVETIGGQMNLGEINDVDHFLKKLYKSLKIPRSRWAADVNEPHAFPKPGEITHEEHKFNMMVQRMRNRFKKVIMDAIIVQLELDGIPSEYISEDYLSIQFTDSNLFQREKELMILDSMIATLSSAQGLIKRKDNPTGLFSEEYIMRKVMENDDEYDLNQEFLEKENPVEPDKNAPGDDSAGMMDDMGGGMPAADMGMGGEAPAPEPSGDEFGSLLSGDGGLQGVEQPAPDLGGEAPTAPAPTQPQA